jgi:hypothetical protein
MRNQTMDLDTIFEYFIISVILFRIGEACQVQIAVLTSNHSQNNAG